MLFLTGIMDGITDRFLSCQEPLWKEYRGNLCLLCTVFHRFHVPEKQNYFISNVENVGCSHISHGMALLNSC